MAVSDALAIYDEREQLLGEKQMRDVERAVMLEVIDSRWKDHLLDMDYLQEGIHLRALGQRDPLTEYKSEGYDLFKDMMDGVKRQSSRRSSRTGQKTWLLHRCHVGAAGSGVQLQLRRRSGLPDSFNDVAPRMWRRRGAWRARRHRRPGGRHGAPRRCAALPGGPTGRRRQRAAAVVEQKIGRNDPCWCGSGKKFKKCHGA